MENMSLHGRRQQRARGLPQDFHTWYRYSVDRGLTVLFFILFLLFFDLFLRWPPEIFSADALASLDFYPVPSSSNRHY